MTLAATLLVAAAAQAAPHETGQPDDAPVVRFDARSRLFVLHGQRGEQLPGDDFYDDFRGGRFVLVASRPWPPAPPPQEPSP